MNSKVENKKAPLQERIQPSVEQWLRGFYDAEFVVTDSFHACVFSILFNKPFIAIENEDRGTSRFTSLLSMFGLKDRLITDGTTFRFNEGNDANANKKLYSLRQKSMGFITKVNG